MTDIIENTTETHTLTSDLSEWAGPVELTIDTRDAPTRNLDNTVEPDKFDWTSRLLDLTYDSILGYPLSPSSPTSFFSFPLFSRVRQMILMRDLFTKFYGFSYSSVDVKITVSDPKGIVGGYMCGWVPYLDYFDKGPDQTMAVWHSTGPLVTTLYNHPNTIMGTFGNSQDISFTIPWSFRYPMYRCKWVLDETPDTQDGRPPPGYPIIWFDRMPCFDVTGFPMPARLKVFAKFNDLKWYGPGLIVDEVLLDAQSGFASAASTFVSTATAVGATILTDKITSAFSKQGYPVSTGDGDSDTFAKPQAVQMAYAGDTTSTGPPIVDPMLIPVRPNPQPSPSVLDFLRRPQYIGRVTTDDVRINIFADPTSFGIGAYWNYFRYFAMVNRYWRGTIKLHFIIAGHPLVEVRSTIITVYPGAGSVLPNGPNYFNTVSNHYSVNAGSKEIIVPMPFCTHLDYVPIVDKPGQNQIEVLHMSAAFEIVSTMLDVRPTIPIFIFASADEDFSFHMPYSPGFYNIDAQVGLPNLGEPEVVSNRFAITTDPGTLPTFEHLLDYMRIWSRCVPFSDYDNSVDEEPIPNPVPGLVCAAWFPPIDRAEDMPANNSWYFTNDFISYFSMLFVFYSGSIGAKVIASRNHRPQTGFLFVGLGDTDINHRCPAHCPFPYDNDEMPANSNFGNGAVITPIAQQPVLEVTIPYRGANLLSYTNWCFYGRGVDRVSSRNSAVQTNIVLQNTSDDYLADAMFRKAGADFGLVLEAGLPPPAMWYQRGWVA